MRTLETQRLILRSFKQADLDDFFEYAKDPEVGPMAGWAPHNDIRLTQNILNHFIQSGEVWAIVHKQSCKVIGSIGIHSDEKRKPKNIRMIGYVLAKAYWGQGLVPEGVEAVLKYCFEDLELDLVTVYHYPHNARSKAVIEKCGFTYEGTLKMASEIYDGRIYDDVCYSLTKEDWQIKLKY